MRATSFKPFFKLQREGRLTPLLSIGAQLKPLYRLTWLAAAGEAGLLHRLAAGPASFDALAEFFTARGQGREALEAWLQFGVRLKLLSLGSHAMHFADSPNLLRSLRTTLPLP